MTNRHRIILVFTIAIAMVMVSVSEAHTILYRQPSTHHRIDISIESSIGSRRKMGQTGKYISYGALMKNNVPCGTRGHSYYGCRISRQVNPYNRGCTFITNCARDGS
ncbi:hypothetical protein L6164_022360 [Bauhinia variegata]|uniref:Uncharacterized protein n=1 Tax=Bauhinia variegata TaxID=167791 RepID=A0ACB9MF18_BAUVA|nr:hypothetical protein L6164_022360 [Bauhinia variegata]